MDDNRQQTVFHKIFTTKKLPPVWEYILMYIVRFIDIHYQLFNSPCYPSRLWIDVTSGHSQMDMLIFTDHKDDPNVVSMHIMYVFVKHNKWFMKFEMFGVNVYCHCDPVDDPPFSIQSDLPIFPYKYVSAGLLAYHNKNIHPLTKTWLVLCYHLCRSFPDVFLKYTISG